MTRNPSHFGSKTQLSPSGMARALLGRQFRVSTDRGRFVASSLAPYVTATVHPSSILRTQTAADRKRELQCFVADLETVAAVLQRLPQHPSADG
jgi:DNA polymerase